MEAHQKYENPSPTIKTNLLSKLFFCWLFPFLRHRYRQDVHMKDIYNITDDNSSSYLGDLLERNWNGEIDKACEKKRSPNLLRVMIKTFGLSYMKLGLVLLLEIILRPLQPYLLRELLRSFQGSNVGVETRWILGVALVLVAFLINLNYQHYSVHCQIMGCKVRVACSSLVYRKILKLNHASLSATTSGEMVNILSNDLQRLDQSAVHFHFIYAVPLQVIVMSYLMYNTVGISCVPGLLVILIQGLFLQGALAKVQEKLRAKVALLTGQRLEAMNDVISGIQVIKMYAWEKPFEALIDAARKHELKVITKLTYMRAVTVAMVVFTERFCLFFTVLTYLLLGNSFTGDLIFSMAQLLNILQCWVCYYFPLSLESFGNIKLSIRRLQEFLLLNEKPVSIPKSITKDIGSIKLTKVTAGWVPPNVTLTDISLNLKQGTLCCIIGKVGSGKTSLLHLLLTELPATSGNVEVSGKMSYASQKPWLFVSSVRNNILFGQKFESHKYNEVVRVCALSKDFQQFPNGDGTMVGERGVSLSGGQRARINLARAVYFDADIYLFDDPLSAVDTHVAKHLMDECILKYLQGKTRILVTHQLQFVRQADIIVLLEEGKIKKIMGRDDFSRENLKLDEEMPTNDGNDVEKSSKSNIPAKKISVTQTNSSTPEQETEIDEEEEMISNDVNFSSYAKYFSTGTNMCFLIFTFLIFIAAQVVTNMTDLWISYWSNQEEEKIYSKPAKGTLSEGDIYLLPKDSSVDMWNLTRFINVSTNYYETYKHDESSDDETEYFYLYVYTGIILSCILLSTIRPMLFNKVCLNSSKAMHKNMLSNIFSAPMRFFETNPSGRILNRFSKDVGSLDEAFPMSMLWSFQIYLVALGIVIMTCMVSPWIAVLYLLAVVASYYTIILFSPTLLKIIKLEANNRSPIFSQISTTVCGLATIRSAKKEEAVTKYFDFLQDTHTSTRLMVIQCGRSFCFYLETIFNVFLAVVTLKFLIFKEDNVRSGDIGLVLIQTNILMGMLQFSITMATDFVNATVSVERILQYTRIDKEDAGNPIKREGLVKGWPHSGCITFSKVYLSYVPHEPPVLKNLSFKIMGGEKIGIVGRTGAGKSSIITCLFRLAHVEGKITIDDVDTDTIDLQTLRSNISIIPQEPVLFSGSLRFNLDPLGTVGDDVLWKVLENVKLKDSVESLDQKITSGGTNFSAGQKQLMCLARAIVRNNKILVMDEATANVDTNTDVLIQRTIRENFRNCTVLTIAHRLNTIMDSDRVLVMSFGQVVEFAHPHELLQQPNGYFLQMVQETGQEVERNLRQIAREDFEKKFRLE